MIAETLQPTAGQQQYKKTASPKYTRSIEDNRPTAVLQKKQVGGMAGKKAEAVSLKKTSNSLSSTVQRVIVVGAGGIHILSNQSQQKLNDALTSIQGMPLIPAGVLVTLMVDNRSTPNPAETTVPAPLTINIGIRKWYIDISSAGEIASLLVHELGVHHLADMMMSPRSRRRERRRNNQNTGFQVNINGTQRGVAGWNAPGNRDAQGRQRDHVNVVRDQGGVAANASARTRAYVEVMLRAGDNINAAGLPVAERDRQLSDLLKTFLFDYARILVTDDGGAWSTMSNAGVIAEVMNWYHNTILARHAIAHPWLMHFGVNVNAGKWGIRAWLIGKLALYLGNRALHGIGQGIRAVGRGIAAIGRGIAGLFQ